MEKKAFTLIELMVAASILSIGIVAVLRSFLSCVSAFNYATNSIEALQYLEAEMAKWEERVMQEEGVIPLNTEDKLQLAGRDALIKTEIVSLQDLKNLTEIKLTISWLKDNRENNISLATYLKKKDETAGN